MKEELDGQHTRELGSGHEFHRGSARAEGSYASWKPWLPEINFGNEKKGERNPSLAQPRWLMPCFFIFPFPSPGTNETERKCRMRMWKLNIEFGTQKTEWNGEVGFHLWAVGCGRRDNVAVRSGN